MCCARETCGKVELFSERASRNGVSSYWNSIQYLAALIRAEKVSLIWGTAEPVFVEDFPGFIVLLKQVEKKKNKIKKGHFYWCSFFKITCRANTKPTFFFVIGGVSCPQGEGAFRHWSGQERHLWSQVIAGGQGASEAKNELKPNNFLFLKVNSGLIFLLS